jgi:hypothetical protein
MIETALRLRARIAYEFSIYDRWLSAAQARADFLTRP